MQHRPPLTRLIFSFLILFCGVFFGSIETASAQCARPCTASYQCPGSTCANFCCVPTNPTGSPSGSGSLSGSGAGSGSIGSCASGRGCINNFQCLPHGTCAAGCCVFPTAGSGSGSGTGAFTGQPTPTGTGSGSGTGTGSGSGAGTGAGAGSGSGTGTPAGTGTGSGSGTPPSPCGSSPACTKDLDCPGDDICSSGCCKPPACKPCINKKGNANCDTKTEICCGSCCVPKCTPEYSDEKLKHCCTIDTPSEFPDSIKGFCAICHEACGKTSQLFPKDLEGTSLATQEKMNFSKAKQCTDEKFRTLSIDELYPAGCCTPMEHTRRGDPKDRCNDKCYDIGGNIKLFDTRDASGCCGNSFFKLDDYIDPAREEPGNRTVSASLCSCCLYYDGSKEHKEWVKAYMGIDDYPSWKSQNCGEFFKLYDINGCYEADETSIANCSIFSCMKTGGCTRNFGSGATCAPSACMPLTCDKNNAPNRNEAGQKFCYPRFDLYTDANGMKVSAYIGGSNPDVNTQPFINDLRTCMYPYANTVGRGICYGPGVYSPEALNSDTDIWYNKHKEEENNIRMSLQPDCSQPGVKCLGSANELLNKLGIPIPPPPPTTSGGASGTGSKSGAGTGSGAGTATGGFSGTFSGSGSASGSGCGIGSGVCNSDANCGPGRKCVSKCCVTVASGSGSGSGLGSPCGVGSGVCNEDAHCGPGRKCVSKCCVTAASGSGSGSGFGPSCTTGVCNTDVNCGPGKHCVNNCCVSAPTGSGSGSGISSGCGIGSGVCASNIDCGPTKRCINKCCR